MSFDQTGRRIVSGSEDKTVRVWDAESGVELACLRGHDDGVTSVSFDRAGRRIVSGSYGQDGTGLGRGERRGAGVPARARSLGHERVV